MTSGNASMNSIDIFPWDDNFCTGIELIDQQHRRLVSLLNLLASHVAFDSDSVQLNTIFEELAAYAVYHFEAEEKIWHEYLPDDASESQHRLTHQRFIESVQALKAAQDRQPTPMVAQETLAFLAKWLASHILESDRHMAHVVTALKSGLSLPQAKQRAAEQMSGGTRDLIDIILSIYGTLSANTLQLMREIAERKRNEETLLQAKRQAEIASKAKSRFLATMSHEIRTPLHGILGVSQLMLMDDLPRAERDAYLQTIIRDGQSLLALFDEVLDLSAAETGQLKLNEGSFTLGDLMYAAASDFASLANERGLELACDEVPDLACIGDAKRLRQMLDCLISNAIKYTEQGSVRLSARPIGNTTKGWTIEFTVADTGIGIPEEMHDQLFQPFSQGDNSNARLVGGIGLGLSMVRSLCELMGGTVGVDSALGNGTRFWFRVPLGKAA